MRYVRARPAVAILALYLIGGLAIGFSLPALQHIASTQYGRSGLAVAFVLNIAMPLLIVGLAVIYPLFWTTLVGSIIATAAFLAVCGMVPWPIYGGWLRDVVARLGPIPTIACLAYQLLAMGTHTVTRLFRRVGEPPDPAACSHCGYLMTGAPSDICPECGRPAGVQSTP